MWANCAPQPLNLKGERVMFSPSVTFPTKLGDADAHRASGVAALLLLAVPFTQFGYSYWLSVQGAMFLAVLLFVSKRLGKLELLLFLVMSATMLLSLTGHLYADSLFYSFLRLLRQIICLYLIVCAAATFSWRPQTYFFDVLLPLVVGVLSGLVIAQFATYTFLGWPGLFVPHNWFMVGFVTLADAWLDFGARHGFLANVRASGTYSEPSYFGFVALTLSVLVVRGVPAPRKKAILLGLLFAALVCSKSASGVIAFAVLMLFAFRMHLSMVHWFVIVVTTLLGGLAADYLLDFNIVERLYNITDPVKEPSGYVRLVLPLKHVAMVLQHMPFGVPMSEFFVFTSRHVDSYALAGPLNPVSLLRGVSTGTDNGFLNLFITHGYGGLLIVILLPFVVRDKLTLLYLLFVSQFNGDMLSPDKAAIVALAISARRVLDSGVTVLGARPARVVSPREFGAVVRARG
jgi:hypothetical protein